MTFTVGCTEKNNTIEKEIGSQTVLQKKCAMTFAEQMHAGVQVHYVVAERYVSDLQALLLKWKKVDFDTRLGVLHFKSSVMLWQSANSIQVAQKLLAEK